jgi:hypothetical protein
MQVYGRRLVALLAFTPTVIGLTARNHAVAAPLDYNGGTYTQNFDGLPTNVTNAAQSFTTKGPVDFTGNVTAASGLDGWQFGNPNGSSQSTEFKSQDGSMGSSGGRGIISFGVNGSTDRALGAVTTSNQVGQFGLVLKNNTQTTLTKVYISFTGELWRRGDIAYTPLPLANDTLIFDYGKGSDINTVTSNGASDPLSFLGYMTPSYPEPAAVGTGVAINGNDPAYRATLSSTLTGLDWAPGETLVLRWTSQDLTGQDDGLGIDDLVFRARSGTSLLPGDFNQDDLLNNRDIQPLLAAVAGPSAFKTANGISDEELLAFGDLNHSGALDDGDVPALLKLLAGNGPVMVPEPSSFVLATVSLLGVGLISWRGRRKSTAV